MNSALTTILTDPAARTASAVEKLLLTAVSETAEPWFLKVGLTL